MSTHHALQHVPAIVRWPTRPREWMVLYPDRQGTLHVVRFGGSGPGPRHVAQPLRMRRLPFRARRVLRVHRERAPGGPACGDRRGRLLSATPADVTCVRCQRRELAA